MALRNVLNCLKDIQMAGLILLVFRSQWLLHVPPALTLENIYILPIGYIGIF